MPREVVTHGRPPRAGRFAWRSAAVLSVISVLSLSGCRTLAEPPTPARHEFHELHMGTRFSITLFAADGSAATNAARAAFARVRALEDAFTDYDPASELLRLCRQPAGQPVPLSTDLFDVLRRAQHFARISAGAFDPTVGPLVQLWRRARRQRELPALERLAEARTLVGHEKLRLDPSTRTATLAVEGMRLDLGAIAKGYAADAALAVLREQGFPRAMVAAAGDIAVGDPPPGQSGWRLGIASIDARGADLTRIVSLKNQAISTSGDTEQFVELGGIRYSHIVDPRTGVGLTNRIGVTVIARDATTTDALATAVSVLGVERGLTLLENLPPCAALIVSVDVNGAKTLVESRRFSRVAPAVKPSSTTTPP
jgi:FAD:protein FMN transferase